MSEEKTIWIGGGNGYLWYLVADLGLFHFKMCEDQSVSRLENIKEEIQPRMTCPLKIIKPEEVIGIKMEPSGAPSGFTPIAGEKFLSDISWS